LLFTLTTNISERKILSAKAQATSETILKEMQEASRLINIIGNLMLATVNFHNVAFCKQEYDQFRKEILGTSSERQKAVYRSLGKVIAWKMFNAIYPAPNIRF
jgi:hypothetical protein